LDQLSVEPWRDDGRDQYDILIVRSDIYAEEDNFLVGIAREGFGTVISTYRFNGLDDKLKYECIKTETMHELGHVFGLLPDNRTEDVEDSLGLHCANRCIMRQGLNVPEDWINMTKDRLRYDALCKRCEKDLKDYFRE
jgi:predicted Zn-dependent protease